MIVSYNLTDRDNYPAEAMKAMLEVIPDVNTVVDTYGMNLLMFAAMYGHPNVLKSIVSTPGLMIDTEVNGAFVIMFFIQLVY